MCSLCTLTASKSQVSATLNGTGNLMILEDSCFLLIPSGCSLKLLTGTLHEHLEVTSTSSLCSTNLHRILPYRCKRSILNYSGNLLMDNTQSVTGMSQILQKTKNIKNRFTFTAEIDEQIYSRSWAKNISIH